MGRTLILVVGALATVERIQCFLFVHRCLLVDLGVQLIIKKSIFDLQVVDRGPLTLILAL